jgi:hypothetical protein
MCGQFVRNIWAHEAEIREIRLKFFLGTVDK